MAESLHVGGILVLIIVNPFPMANKAGLTRLKADADPVKCFVFSQVYASYIGLEAPTASPTET